MSLAAKHSARFGRHVLQAENLLKPRNSVPGVNTNGSISLTAAIPGAVILGVIVIGIAIWRLRIYLRRRNAAASSLANATVNGDEKGATNGHTVHHINFEGAQMEKPSEAHMAPASPVAETHGGWVPQIKSVSSPHPEFPLAAQHPAAIQALPAAGQSDSASLGRVSLNPPPAYHPRRQSMRQSVSAVPPSPPPQGTLPALPAVPTISASSQVAAEVETNPRHVAKKFPRLMVVVKTFQPTLDDELAIETSDVVRLIEEYEDGWCLAQRVGNKDNKKGAVPRAYLDERTSGTSF